MKKTITILAWILLLMNISCKSTLTGQMTDAQLGSKAQMLAEKYIITDGHVDLPYRLEIINFRLEKEFLGIPLKSDDGDFDFERARKGGLDAPFMSIYIPARYQTDGGAKEFANSLIDMVTGIAKAHPDHYTLAITPKEIKDAHKLGKIALPMGMENGAPIEDDLTNVEYFFKRGIRYVTLTHSKDNLICDSSYDTTRTWNGLSPFGHEVVLEMNRVGMMVDISHVSDSTFYQVLGITRAPVIASHSSCRKFTPGFERNMNDDMLKALAKNHGVIQINFGSSFLDGKIQEESSKHRKAIAQRLADKGVTMDDDAAKPIVEAYRLENPSLYSDVQMVANHIDHVVKLAGIDHVGLGSDFDGVGDSLPTGLKDVSQYPNLIEELLRRGYSDSDIEKICSANVFRVWSKVIEVSGA